MNAVDDVSHIDPGFPGGATLLMAVYAGDDANLLLCAIESAYAGRLRPDACVLVVDGPVSNLLAETIDRCVERFALRVLRLEHNEGLANALNAGLEWIETEWVLRADADDINLPDRFAKQAAMLLANPELDVLSGAILEIDPDGSPIGMRQLPLTHDAIKRFAACRNPINHMTVAFRRRSVLAVGGYPPIDRKEDYGLWAALIMHGARFAITDEVLVHVSSGRDMYRRRGGWRYALTEIELQRHLVDCGIKQLPSAWLHGLLRASIFLLPTDLRGWFYRHFLRSKQSVRTARPNVTG